MRPLNLDEMFRRFFILLVFVLLSVQAYSQHRISAGVRSGYPFSPSKPLLDGANSLGRPLNVAASADLQYGFVFPGSSYQGVGVSVFSLFDHEDVGTPVSVYVFQGARIARLSRSLSLDYEWNFGVSFGWHRHDEHPYNIIIGSKINAYINGAIMLSWHPSDNWQLSVGPDFTHYSNGHTRLPNVGLNTVGVRLNAARTFGGELFPRIAQTSDVDKEWTDRISCDVTAFGSLKKCVVDYRMKYYQVDGCFAVAGVHVNPFYDIHRNFRVGLSLDMIYDESANLSDHIAGTTLDDHIRFFRPSFAEQFAMGLSVRTELVMPIFSVHFGVGHNIIYRGDDFRGLYQIVALKTRLTKNLYIHTGYQFWHFTDPGHLLLGLGWCFN